MLVSDGMAAFCSVMIFVLSVKNGLRIWHIYMANFIIGFMNAFQGPASAVAIGKIVLKDKVAQVSGMNSFSGNLITVMSSVLSASLFAFGGLKVILYQKIPEKMQGRIFAVRNALQFSTMPFGILLGGFLADYVFEPFMETENLITAVLHILVGEGAGSGMAVMFLCTGILGGLFSFISYRQRDIQTLH